MIEDDLSRLRMVFYRAWGAPAEHQPEECVTIRAVL
jgi:hypothetical protein